MSVYRPVPDAAIVGVGELPPLRTTPGASTLGLLGRAARLAIEDAAMPKSEIDGLFVGPQVGETPQHAPAMVAEYLGLSPTVASVVDLGGATAIGMLWRAGAAIASGMCTSVLCVLGKSRDPDRATRAANRNPIREFESPVGASGANLAYALSARAHMDRFGTTAEQLAAIAAAERSNAQLNSDAVFRGRPISVEQVLASPVVVDPIHRDEAVMPCGGAAALVVTSIDRSVDHPHPTISMLGASELVTHRSSSHNPDFVTSPLAETTGRAFANSGLTISDVDLWSIYDCYSIMVAISVEDVGLCAKGEGGPFLAEQDFSHLGTLPLNTHGGQLGCGQADLAGGMGHLIEAVRQLRFEAGDRQIPNCATALVTGIGATMSEGATVLLGR